MNIQALLRKFGMQMPRLKGAGLPVFSPVDGLLLAEVPADSPRSVSQKIARAQEAFVRWREVPAPRRGELIRLFAEELRAHKEELGRLVTIESGKILEEGKGEVQEMIDICDYAVGLSRTVGGHTFPSERPRHIMHENWYPLGVVAIISAFNFPAAVWSWNAALALVCGNAVIWKPSEKTPLTALACQAVFEKALRRFGKSAPPSLSQIAVGGPDVGGVLVNDPRVALVSATGSSRMGKAVGEQVARRFGRSLLELGGNNAIIVTPSADLEIALPSIVFGAVGTAGQRCTSTRRLLVHESIIESLTTRLKSAYQALNTRIGNPLDRNTLVGPLIDRQAYQNMQSALDAARDAGGMVSGGSRVEHPGYPRAYFVQPAIVEIGHQADIVCRETFAPILYVMPYRDLMEAMTLHNAVPQGLSSAIFTSDLREAELFRQYSDCGIANVNIGTSGAEIGGAFGGEKETGGGRESGSDSWKYYMRRQTSTTYFGMEVPVLAQGIRFE